jgi:7-carboxy-7-deazaguanine synthase
LPLKKHYIIKLDPKIIEGIALPLMESFYTIQGEGFHQGKASYFIRFAGCDVGCHWCDVKESWDEQLHPVVDVNEIVKEAEKHPARIAVITGGEPLMYNLDVLTNFLHEKGFKTHLETSGAYPLSGNWDWICLSPKKFKAPIVEFLPLAHELKVVIFNKSDFAWAESYAHQVGPQCHLYLQPEWGKSKEILPLMIDYAKENPKWRTSLQVHKYMGIP